MNKSRYSRFLMELDTIEFFEDFLDSQADVRMIDTITDSGTVLTGNNENGVATLTPSDASVVNNDEAYLAMPNAVFKFGINREIYGRAKLRFTEVAATILNVAFGFQNAVGANSLIDDGGGLKVSGSTLGIYKVDGEALWRCVSSCNGTSTVTQSNKAAVAATDYVLEIFVGDWDGVSMQVSFKVDGEYLRDSNNRIIYHSVAIASAAAMQLFVGAKLGADTNNDTVLADYVYGSQLRV